MRNLCLLVGAGLLATGLGCCRTLQYTAGVCDCNPPPVESLLVAPTGAHSSLGVYANMAYAPAVPAVPVRPVMPAPAIVPSGESIQIMPKPE